MRAARVVQLGTNRGATAAAAKPITAATVIG
jgi:hypothetical protein